jgi:hypothetical protein
MIALLAGALITSVLVTSTGAFFTDAQNAGANIFSTGTLDISTAPASAIVSFSSMVPGDTVTAPVTVANDGSMQLRYAVRSTTTENLLAAQLDLTIKTGVTTCNNGGFAADGTVIYGAGDAGNTGGLELVGDPTQGMQAGDRVLDAANDEVLCVQVSLPTATGNTYQGLTTTATLEFLAEQTANNS